MSNHTPGPWNYKRINGEVGADAAQFTICKTPTIDLITANAPYELIEESRANGALIAAAPDMFELLKVLWVNLPPSVYQEKCGISEEEFGAVVAKAKGE